MSDVAELVDALRRHVPGSSGEAVSVRRTLALLSWLRSPFDEHADPTHVTGSAIVVDDEGRVLLHRHKRLGIWLQPGGHLDPGEDPAEAAIRETLEETGLHARHPDTGPQLVHVDVHEGPRGHVHLDVRYLLRAPGDIAFAPAAGESAEVAWFGPEDASAASDRSLAEAVQGAMAAVTSARSLEGPHHGHPHGYRSTPC